jgi:hypothetical protein
MSSRKRWNPRVGVRGRAAILKTLSEDAFHGLLRGPRRGAKG